jgi:hypothetical protein
VRIACLKSLRIGSVQFASNSTDIKIASIAAVHLSRKTATTSKKLDFSTASVKSGYSRKPPDANPSRDVQAVSRHPDHMQLDCI